MKYLLAILTLSLGLTAYSQTSTYTLSVQITNLDEPTGKIGVRLLDSDKKVVSKQWIDVRSNEVEAKFTDIPKGNYALSYYHDANDNDELDTGMFGIPTEGYGNSNDIKGMFGPPEFEKTIFELSGDMTMTMKTIN